MPYFEDRNIKLFHGNSLNVLRELPERSVQCVVTSPPYFGLRQYSTVRWIGGDPYCDHVADPSATKKFGNHEFNENRPSREATKMPGYYADVCPKCGAQKIDEQLGNEETLDEYVSNLVAIFREVKRVLRDDGIVLLNLGDSFAGSGKGVMGDGTIVGGEKQKTNYGTMVGGIKHYYVQDGLKNKDLMLVPFRCAMALQSDGWYLRNAIPWIKRNPMPGSQQDRPTTSTEYIFLLAKSEHYFFDMEAVKRPTAAASVARAKRAVGTSHKNLNGAPGQTPHTLAQPREHGAGEADSMRALREYDFFLDSLQYILDGGQGMLCDDDLLALVVNVKGYKGSHYATFPELLAETCIKAGVSAVGGCPKCGAPWERVLEKTPATSKKCPKTDALYQAQGGSGEKITGTIGMSGGGRVDGTSITISWRPTCNCNPEWRDLDYLALDKVQALLLSDDEFKPVPQVVLDPFNGAGTTGLAALELQHEYWGIDLSADYLDQSIKRLRKAIDERPLMNTGIY